MRHVISSLAISLFAVSVAPLQAQHLVTLMTPEVVDEAIRLAADERAARTLLDAYILQTRAGWGDGPLVGSCSTPFSRVLQAAVAAGKKGMPFTMADVTPDLIVPELHVVATSQKAASDDFVVNVYSVVLAPRGSKEVADVLAPLKTLELTKVYQELTHTAFQERGVVAVFPLTGLPANAEVRVVFDQIVRGSSALSRCRECIVPLNLSRMR